jgi:hypothetical protein
LNVSDQQQVLLRVIRVQEAADGATQQTAAIGLHVPAGVWGVHWSAGGVAQMSKGRTSMGRYNLVVQGVHNFACTTQLQASRRSVWVRGRSRLLEARFRQYGEGSLGMPLSERPPKACRISRRPLEKFMSELRLFVTAEASLESAKKAVDDVAW